MLPLGPHWKSHVLHPQVPTKCQAILYYCYPINCLQSLLSHPLFACRISFIPWKVWSSSAWIVHIYEDWMSGNHAWDLQVSQVVPTFSVFLTKKRIRSQMVWKSSLSFGSFKPLTTCKLHMTHTINFLVCPVASSPDNLWVTMLFKLRIL